MIKPVISVIACPSLLTGGAWVQLPGDLEVERGEHKVEYIAIEGSLQSSHFFPGELISSLETSCTSVRFPSPTWRLATLSCGDIIPVDAFLCQVCACFDSKSIQRNAGQKS